MKYDHLRSKLKDFKFELVVDANTGALAINAGPGSNMVGTLIVVGSQEEAFAWLSGVRQGIMWTQMGKF